MERKTSRPEIGIMPRWIHDDNRMEEILDCLERKSKNGDSIDPDWIVELRDLIKVIQPVEKAAF